jgi:predicted GNAT family acetyltransferase
MPNFFQTAAKFLGFSTEVAAKAHEIQFVKETLGATSQISMKIGAETHGYVAWETVGKQASVYSTMMSEQFKGKGYGKQMYEKAFEAARMEGITTFTSDITGHTEAEAGHVWRSLGRKGYKITESAEGIKFRADLTYRNVAENTANQAKESVMIQHAQETAACMMKAGEGHDSTTLLRRGINATSGSRRTSSVL